MIEQPSLSCSIRCPVCRMHLDLCVCNIMPHFDLNTRIVIVMQQSEFNLCSNSGHLIPKILKNSGIVIRGAYSKNPVSLEKTLSEKFEPYVLFPHKDAVELNTNFVSQLKKPLALVVPDGNWKQAGRILRHVDKMNSLKKVCLPPGPQSSYRLRVSPRSDGVCTLEAVARALGVLEGQKIQKELEQFFNILVERVLWTRGKLKLKDII